MFHNDFEPTDYCFTISTDSSQSPLFAWKELVRSFFLLIDMHSHVTVVYVMLKKKHSGKKKKKKNMPRSKRAF